MTGALAPSAFVAPPPSPKLQAPLPSEAAGARPGPTPSAPAQPSRPFAQMLRREQGAEPAARPREHAPSNDGSDDGERSADEASAEKSAERNASHELAALRRARLGVAKPAASAPSGGAGRSAKSAADDGGATVAAADREEGHADADAPAAGDASTACAAAPGHAPPPDAANVGTALLRDGPQRALRRPEAEPTTVDAADDAARSRPAGRRDDAAGRLAAADDARAALASSASSATSPADAASASQAASFAAALGGSEAARAPTLDAPASRLESGTAAAATGIGASGPAPSADAASASASAAATGHVPAAVDSPEFARAFGVEVSVLARHGVQHAELRMNPAEMGPVSVRIALDGTQARVDFGADAAATRAAIEAGLPDLAAALREAGLTLAGGGVSAHAGSGGHGTRDGDAAQRLRAGGRGDAALRTDARDDAAAPRLRRTVAAGGVDLYA